MWYLNCFLHIISSSMRWKSHHRLVQPRTQDSLCPQNPVEGQKQVCPQRGSVSAFLIFSLPVAEVKLQVNVPKVQGIPVRAKPLLMGQRSNLVCNIAENNIAPHILPPARKSAVPLQERQQRRLEPAFPLYQKLRS